MDFPARESELAFLTKAQGLPWAVRVDTLLSVHIEATMEHSMLQNK